MTDTHQLLLYEWQRPAADHPPLLFQLWPSFHVRLHDGFSFYVVSGLRRIWPYVFLFNLDFLDLSFTTVGGVSVPKNWKVLGIVIVFDRFTRSASTERVRWDGCVVCLQVSLLCLSHTLCSFMRAERQMNCVRAVTALCYWQALLMRTGGNWHFCLQIKSSHSCVTRKRCFHYFYYFVFILSLVYSTFCLFLHTVCFIDVRDASSRFCLFC